jgi:NTP pyrophosphatase (non-canonical NTP hydrolase)
MNDQLREILIILQEECGEVVQDVAKCFRFGPDQMIHGGTQTNLQRLESELGDLQAMIGLLVRELAVSAEGIEAARLKKLEKLRMWSNINID